jgi:hypothetical protein
MMDAHRARVEATRAELVWVGDALARAFAVASRTDLEDGIRKLTVRMLRHQTGELEAMSNAELRRAKRHVERRWEKYLTGLPADTTVH